MVLIIRENYGIVIYLINMVSRRFFVNEVEGISLVSCQRGKGYFTGPKVINEVKGILPVLKLSTR
jgi:hypothetical protein